VEILVATTDVNHDRFGDLLTDSRPPCPLDICRERMQLLNHPCRPLACTMMDRRMSHDDEAVLLGNGRRPRVQMISMVDPEDPCDDCA